MNLSGSRSCVESCEDRMQESQVFVLGLQTPGAIPNLSFQVLVEGLQFRQGGREFLARLVERRRQHSRSRGPRLPRETSRGSPRRTSPACTDSLRMGSTTDRESARERNTPVIARSTPANRKPYCEV